jgi:hypothetical protein
MAGSLPVIETLEDAPHSWSCRVDGGQPSHQQPSSNKQHYSEHAEPQTHPTLNLQSLALRRKSWYNSFGMVSYGI